MSVTTTLSPPTATQATPALRLNPIDTSPTLADDPPPPSQSEVQATKKEPWIREASCHLAMLTAGWSDASSGPLIPFIQRYYGISYTVVSMLFVGQAAGFLLAAGALYFLTRRWGLGKVIVLGAALQAFAYALLIPAFPFPLFPVLYAISGFGMAIQDSCANVYVACLPSADKKLGVLHASYGLGAALCPLAATAFASSFPRQFSHFWAISLGIACLNTLILLVAFRFSYVVDESEVVDTTPGDATPPSPREELELEAQPSSPTGDSTRRPSIINDSKSMTSFSPATTYPPDLRTDGLSRVKKEKREEPSVMRQALLSRVTILMSLFILFYVGSEVSMGGWVVTFLIENRNGGADAGYVATGFWLGLTLGRVALIPLNRLVGEKRVLYLYLLLALALEFAIWFANSLVGNAVVVAMIGFIIGPAYPIAMSLMTKILPRKLHGPSISFVAAFGQAGAACFPFAVGALSQRFSPAALQPVMIVLFAAQLGLWFFVPDVVRKKE